MFVDEIPTINASTIFKRIDHTVDDNYIMVGKEARTHKLLLLFHNAKNGMMLIWIHSIWFDMFWLSLNGFHHNIFSRYFIYMPIMNSVHWLDSGKDEFVSMQIVDSVDYIFFYFILKSQFGSNMTDNSNINNKS